MMRKIFGISIINLILVLNSSLFAQIEHGGNPMIVDQLISSKVETIWFQTPALPNDKFQHESVAVISEDHLKPLKFAHSFQVSLTPENSGVWFEKDNTRIWILGIESANAYSISLKFSKYKLPEGARLFIYNDEKSDLIGAFTSSNNQPSEVLATLPVAGDKIIVQYEEPCDCEFHANLKIAKISHDFIGIKLKASDPRRPLGISGTCNVDVNCDIADDYNDAKNSVCRILIEKPSGDELCSGILINNTASNKKPYLLTAKHCIENNTQAQGSIFVFNYESPYCNSINGDNIHSISGSTLKASFDSLDFSLVELSVQPPNYYRPYYAGWDVSGEIPSRTYTIHHPLGDIKKVSIDNDPPSKSNFNYNYIKSAFWEIEKWENGVTEIGSSGGPLFDSQSRVIGTLTGGKATCTNPVKDYFEMLSRSWDYKNDQTKQLKFWLDPINSGDKKITGLDPYEASLKCTTLTNFQSGDKHSLSWITTNIPTDGYWSGTNNKGYREYAEKFSGINSCEIHGVSLGIAKKHISNTANDHKITLNVYEGTDIPRRLVHTQEFDTNNLLDDAMNYFTFNKLVSTNGNFFISYSISMMNVKDTFTVYQAVRDLSDNTFYLKNSLEWKDYKTARNIPIGSALLMEVVACNVNSDDNPPVIIDEDLVCIYPNPVSSDRKVTIYAGFEIKNPYKIKVYDMLGKDVAYQTISQGKNSIKLLLNTTRAGIYFVLAEFEGKQYTEKISVLP